MPDARFAALAPAESALPRPAAPDLDPSLWVVVFFEADDRPVSEPDLSDPPAAAREAPADFVAPLRDGVFETDVFCAVLPTFPLATDLPAAEPLDFVESGVAPRLLAVFAAFGLVVRESADLRTVVELRPADLPVDFAGTVRLALPRLVALLPAEVRVDALRVEVAFAGGRLVAAVLVDAVFDDAAFDAVLPDAVLLDGLVAVVDARLVDALPVDTRFAGALRAAEDLVAVDLPPVPVVLPVVVLVAAFLAAGLLAPVFLVADLRGLVVAMHLSRGLVAPRATHPR